MKNTISHHYSNKWVKVLGLTLLFLLSVPFSVTHAVSDDCFAPAADTPTRILSAHQYFQQAYNSAESGDHEAAIQAYTRSIRLNPDVPCAYNNRGYSFSQLGQYEEAIADYTLAIELDPTFVLAYTNRGNAYRQLGEVENAIADYTRAIEFDPLEGYVSRGYAYQQLGRHEEAIADYTKAIEMNPANSSAYLNLGVAYAQMEDAENAAQAFWGYLSRGELEPTLLENSEAEFEVEMAANRAYQVVLPLEADQVITISATALEQGQVDSLLVLVDEAGQAVAANDDLSMENPDSRIEAFRIPKDGDYTLWISHAGGGKNGIITLSIHD